MERKEKFITYKNKIVFIKINTSLTERTLKQYAENEACFMFVNKGEVNVRAPHEHLTLNKDVGMIAKCLNYFVEPVENKEICKNDIEFTGVYLYPELVKDLFDLDITKSNFKNDYNVKQVLVDLMLKNFRESIDILIENPELVDDAIVKTKLKEFVQLLVKSENTPSQLDFLAALFRPNETEFKIVIKNNLYSNLSITELSLLTHLSESSFKRKFKEVFKESPGKYITRKKIERAAELLKISNDRISDIAYDVGFDSVKTFNRNFSKHFGQSPKEFCSDLK